MDENSATITAILIYEVIEDPFLSTDIDSNSATDLTYLARIVERLLDNAFHECSGIDMDGDCQVNMSDLC
jgi:hypothetical protein